MTIEDRIRAKAHRKMRVWITTRKRSRTGFVVTVPGLTGTPALSFPNKRTALAYLLAAVRCAPLQQFTLKPKK